MDSLRTESYLRPSASEWEYVRHILRWMTLASAALLGAFTILLLTRRLSGALRQPLATVALITAGLLLALGAWAFRAVWSRVGSASETGKSGRFVYAVFASLVLLIGLALTLPGSSRVGLAVMWTTLVVAELGLWIVYGAELTSNRELPAESSDSTREPSDADPPPPSEAGQIRQQLTRGYDTDGRDQLYGLTRTPLEKNQRTASVHLAFCPPFATRPQMTIEQTTGPKAKVKLTQIYPYGARIDVRLAQPAPEPTFVTVNIQAVSEPNIS